MLDKLFNTMPTVYKWDRFWVGFLPGLFCPLLGIIFFYVVWFSGMSFMEYMQYVKRPFILSRMLSFGALVNLFIFFPLIWNDRYNAARGVIGATIIYVIPILVTKFLL